MAKLIFITLPVADPDGHIWEMAWVDAEAAMAAATAAAA